MVFSLRDAKKGLNTIRYFERSFYNDVTSSRVNIAPIKMKFGMLIVWLPGKDKG
jgi:hypothetical protein